MDYEKMCMGCMRERENAEGPCPYCGFDEKQFVAPAYSLVNRSILNGKYMTGRFLEESGYFITYLGWDLNLEINVMIHEYYPCTMLWRDDMTQPGVGCRPEDQEAFANGKRKFFTRAKGSRGKAGCRYSLILDGTGDAGCFQAEQGRYHMHGDQSRKYPDNHRRVRQVERDLESYGNLSL